jgi:predicted nucleic acid-binding protein
MTVVLDASAMVDLLLGNQLGHAVSERVEGERLAVPAHFDAEVLSALVRLSRAGRLSTSEVQSRLALLAEAPLTRHGLPELLEGAWRRRGNLRVLDALYVELSHQLGDLLLVTTDAGLDTAHPAAELVTAP